MTNTINPKFRIDLLLEFFKKIRIRYLIYFILLLPLIWLGFQAVQEYWSQPLTTEIIHENLVNDYKVTFPLITFCPPSWNFFQSLTADLNKEHNLKLDYFKDDLDTERKRVIDSAHFYTGSKYIDLEHLDSQLIHIST